MDRVARRAGGSWGVVLSVTLGLIASMSLMLMVCPSSALGTEHARASVASAEFSPRGSGVLQSGRPTWVRRLGGNVYEYYWVVSTGAGVHHRIGVHRVVQVRSGKPVATSSGIFLLHGDGGSFDNAFRGGTSASDSIAVFLASEGIDVWGIDLGWTLVGANTTDTSFMRGWGLQRDVNDLERGLAFARSVRVRTGSSHRKLTLLAWSRGGWIGYALLNEESQMPLAQRQVGAFIPVDTLFKTNDPMTQAAACASASSTNSDIRRGVSAYDHQSVIQEGRLAQTAPNKLAPVFPSGETNLQVSLRTGAAPFQTAMLITPYFHQVAGVFPGGDITQLPTGLAYTAVPRWNQDLITTSLYEPAAMIRDTWAITCNRSQPNRFDDHLNDVTVPVFYVGAAGGFGASGLYSLTLLGSKDVSSHIISLLPPAQAAMDFGHVDLFRARDAQSLVWTPIYDWLSQHPT
jgi:hypothetical protein